jgi:hypothetical protein
MWPPLVEAARAALVRPFPVQGNLSLKNGNTVQYNAQIPAFIICSFVDPQDVDDSDLPGTIFLV